MANTLLINKLTGGYFQFVLNGDTAKAVRGIKNDLLAVGEQLHFKTGNGANIIKEQFIYPADLTIVASGTFTFTNVDQVWTKLIEIGYFDWINSGGSGTGASRFDDLLDTFKYTGKDGQVVIVNESQQKLQTVELYNYRKFTDLEDTPDLLLANKMVATNAAGTALIFKNLPEDPVNYLNSIGFFDYNDLATQTTPISVTANTDTKLTNDTLGAYTNINYPPYGVSSLWDATTNRFNFSQLSIGDTIDVRVHLQVTTTTSNQTYKIGAKFGIGSASAFDNIIFTDQAKSAGVHEVSFVAPFYIGEANILNNPAELYINTDASASVKVDGWYIRVLRRNINIVNVETGVDDATTTAKGILRLAGDLAGTATNPTVPALADKALKTTTITINGTTFDLSANREWNISASANWGGIGGFLSNQTDLQTVLDAKEPSILSGTTAQYFRGDKTWQTLDKTAVGLANVDNTSDANKPISTATQNALNAKANDNAVVKLTGNQSITGIKTFTTVSGNALTVNNSTNDWGQIINNNSGGIGLDISNFGNGTALFLRSNNTSTGNVIRHIGIDGLLKFNLSSTGNVTANSFIKSGGTSSQFLKADGSVDSTSYQTVLTNPITGTGTTNFLSKFTASGTIGNSQIFDNGTNVGIGTTSPTSKLHLYDNATVYLDLESATASSLVRLKGGAYSGFLGETAGVNQWYVTGGGALKTLTMGTDNTERMRITSSGNVGIGTTSPTKKLEVAGSSLNSLSGQSIEINPYWDAGYSAIGTITNHHLAFVTNGSEKMRITSNGNVGIGKTDPAQKLDVNGLINSTNGISVGGSGVSVVWTGTQAAYDAIGTKSSTTIYFIQ